jgi:hypothetical protein
MNVSDDAGREADALNGDNGRVELAGREAVERSWHGGS